MDFFNSFNKSTLIGLSLSFLPLILLPLIGIFFKKYVHTKLKKLVNKTDWKIDNIIFDSFENSIVFWFILFGIYLSLSQLPFQSDVLNFILNLNIAIIVLSISFSVSNVCVKILELFASNNTSFPSTTMFSNLFRIIIISMGLLVVFQNFGISIAPVLTALGVGGLAISLALKDTLSDLFAGLHILLSRKVIPGDLVELDTSQRGVIENITWRNTTIKDRTNNMLVVPNSKLSTAIITNFDVPVKHLTARISCGVSYDSDLDKVESVVLDVAKQVINDVEGANKDYKPGVTFLNFGESSIDFRVFIGAIDYSGQWSVTHEFIKRLHKRFKIEGIEIPYPIRTVYNKNDK